MITIEGLQESIVHLVKRYANREEQANRYLQVLSRPGFPLDQNAECRAARFISAVSRSLSAENSVVVLGASACMEIIMAACYLFDHVGDQEIDPQFESTPAEDLSIAIGLLCCGSVSIESVLRDQGFHSLQTTALFASFLDACEGQYLDAHFQRAEVVSLDAVLAMTKLKAGALGDMTGALGALASGHSDLVIALFKSLGANLFTFAQLIDDMRDAWPEEESLSDFKANKKTIPILLFNMMNQDQTSLAKRQNASEDVPQAIANAKAATRILAEAFLNRGKDDLDLIRQEGLNTDSLEEFLESISALG